MGRDLRSQGFDVLKLVQISSVLMKAKQVVY